MMAGNYSITQSTTPEKSAAVELTVEDVLISGVPESPMKLNAIAFGGEDELPAPPALSAEEEGRLWRKIDLHLMPIIMAMYLCSFLDRNNIGNAKLQGLVTQLNLTGGRYNVALTLWFISYSVVAIPSNLVLKKFRPSRWLPGITVLWGITTTLMGLVKNYQQLVGVRVCLGVVEAALAPGVFFYLSVWYPRHMLQTRVGLFLGGATLAGAFSGLLAYAISFMSGTAGLLGWSWIFIIEGIITVFVGIVAFFVLVDFPNTASFLTPEERAFVVHRKKHDNSSVGEEEHFASRHIWEALTDWQVWLLSLIHLSTLTSVYGISLFLPSIINGFGFNVAISQLLTIPPYVIGTANLILWAVWSDRIKRRSPFTLCGQLLCLIGLAINISNVPIGAKYFGTFFITAGAYSIFPTNVSWLLNNVAGQYKRSVAIAVQVIFGNISGIIASNIYRTQDAPRYVLGHGIELSFVGMGILLWPVAVLTYVRLNSRKEAMLREAEVQGISYTPEQLQRMGDRAPDFKYTL